MFFASVSCLGTFKIFSEFILTWKTFDTVLAVAVDMLVISEIFNVFNHWKINPQNKKAFSHSKIAKSPTIYAISKR
jgi:hypothetical protein